jgi:hypothetical protein
MINALRHKAGLGLEAARTVVPLPSNRHIMNDKPLPNALFRLGTIVATPGVMAMLSSEEQFIAIQQHQVGDWGDLGELDRETNNSAVKDGGRIMSVYQSFNGERFWVITEADRSVTTLLLPRQY